MIFFIVSHGINFKSSVNPYFLPDFKKIINTIIIKCINFANLFIPSKLSKITIKHCRILNH